MWYTTLCWVWRSLIAWQCHQFDSKKSEETTLLTLSTPFKFIRLLNQESRYWKDITTPGSKTRPNKEELGGDNPVSRIIHGIKGSFHRIDEDKLRVYVLNTSLSNYCSKKTYRFESARSTSNLISVLQLWSQALRTETRGDWKDEENRLGWAWTAHVPYWSSAHLKNQNVI